MKKLFTLCCAAVAACCAWADTEEVGDYTWTYRINGEEAEIYNDRAKAAISPLPTEGVTIPSTLGGKPVTRIGEWAFFGCSEMPAVKITEDVTSIGMAAFSGCHSLEVVTIPSGVASIGDGAFFDCGNLMNIAIEDDNSAYRMQDGFLLSKDGESLVAVAGGGLMGDVTIPDGVMKIVDGSFGGCFKMTSLTIPDSVTSIGVETYFFCSNLTHVIFKGNAPSSVGRASFSRVGPSCTAYVERNSTGWGVNIPGFWHGIRIVYTDDVSIYQEVEFDAQDGTVDEEKRLVEKGKTVGDLPKPTLKGYTFNGWYTKASGGTKITKTTKVKKDVTYYAQWTANKYTIKFNANGGTGTMKPRSATYDKAVTLTANAFKRTNWSFLGWATKKDATEAKYTNKQKVKNLTATAGKTVTLYALWKRNTYTVKFSANGGTGATKKQTLDCGSSVALMKNTYKREGFVFAGWATKKGGKVVYKNKTSVRDLAKNGASVTLYAIWKPEAWAVKTYETVCGYSLLGGKMADATLTVASNGKISGKFVRRSDKKAFPFKANAFTEFSEGALRVKTTLTYGSKKCDLYIVVSRTGAGLDVTYKGKDFGSACLFSYY